MTFSTVFQIQKKGVGSVNAEGEANEYETLKHSFTTYFTPKQNSTYEIYKFRQAKNRREEKQLMSFTQDLERWQTSAISMTSNKKY